VSGGRHKRTWVTRAADGVLDSTIDVLGLMLGRGYFLSLGGLFS
jgi:hypothetical protein